MPRKVVVSGQDLPGHLRAKMNIHIYMCMYIYCIYIFMHISIYKTIYLYDKIKP